MFGMLGLLLILLALWRPFASHLTEMEALAVNIAVAVTGCALIALAAARAKVVLGASPQSHDLASAIDDAIRRAS